MSSIYASVTNEPDKNIPRAIAIAGMVTLALSILGSLAVAALVPSNKYN